MTNKPTWEEELRKGWDNGKLCWNGNPLTEISYERVKDFISTKLAEQRKEIIDKIEEVGLENIEFAILSQNTIGGFALAKERIINLIKQD